MPGDGDLSILLIEGAAYQDVYLSCSATLDSDCDYAGLALDSRLRAVARARRASRPVARAAACQGLVFGFVDATNFWVRLYDNGNDQVRVYQVVDGTWTRTLDTPRPLKADQLRRNCAVLPSAASQGRRTAPPSRSPTPAPSP